MDKKNYTRKNVEAQEIEETIRAQKAKLIMELEKREILQRKRVIKDVSVLVTAFYHYITESWSFRTLSVHMCVRHGVKMSDTAWRKQFLKVAKVFLEVVLETTRPTVHHTSQVIYALDSTDFSTEGQTGTSVRAHTCYALNGPVNIVSKVTDVHTAESVMNFPIESGALYLADRAYGTAAQVSYLINQKADFLIRVSPNGIKLYQDESCKKRVDFNKMIKGQQFSVNCYIKHKKRSYPVRVLGEKLPAEKQDLAEKKFVGSRAKKARKFVRKRLTTQSG